MDNKSSLLTNENNSLLIDVAKKFNTDSRVEFMLADAYKWITEFKADKFDFTFADEMPGKYDLFDETIDMLKSGGSYVIDDMLPQPNRPLGYDKKAADFINK